jgi:hypothetical protein
MKTKSYLAALVAVCALILNVNAQLSPSGYNLLTNVGALTVEGVMTTNLVNAKFAPIGPSVGQNGFGIFIGSAGTNATTTTNTVVTFELANIDTKTGYTNIIDNQGTFAITVQHNGTTRFDFLTNMPSTIPNIGNASLVRIKSIQNTNTASLFISNAVLYTR